MENTDTRRTDGQRLADLRNGSRSSRHVVKSRKGTRSSRKDAAIRDSRAR
jgi:hypothetical protein